MEDETFKNVLTTHLKENTTYTVVPPKKFLENMEKGNQLINCDKELRMYDLARHDGRGGKRKKKKRKPKRKTKRKKRRKTKRKTKRRKRRRKR